MRVFYSLLLLTLLVLIGVIAKEDSKRAIEIRSKACLLESDSYYCKGGIR